VSVKFTILGSGSAGNCAYLETSGARILIDAGFSTRQIRQRLASIGRVPENLSAILLTHEHSDHISGLLGLADKFQIPVYCNRGTQDGTIWAFKEKWSKKTNLALENSDTFRARINWRLFETGASFEVGDVGIETFSIPHDAQDPVGFILRTAAGTVGMATDLGHVTKLVSERIRAANVLVLESNHDVKMLQNCPRRSWALKQRILGRHGHISNVTAAETVAQIMSAGLRQLYLAHLSRECNTPELAQNIMAEQLFQIGATHVRLQMTGQEAPCPTLELQPSGAESASPTATISNAVPSPTP
jgi:phosphoribosyl 1,2-cyclic phosphodiesterase